MLKRNRLINQGGYKVNYNLAMMLGVLVAICAIAMIFISEDKDQGLVITLLAVMTVTILGFLTTVI